ncbi:hypothetical protein M5K25_010095 [Dendrobium thyrsiflorum]|uniref:Uncharacterized protein n=1 Tax=Dendrobium thyrsiflorum TaxID=117978 RepID=A0ABD0UZH0_DENTH
MGPNQRPKARLEGSNHNLDYQTISEHVMLILDETNPTSLRSPNSDIIKALKCLINDHADFEEATRQRNDGEVRGDAWLNLLEIGGGNGGVLFDDLRDVEAMAPPVRDYVILNKIEALCFID